MSNIANTSRISTPDVLSKETSSTSLAEGQKSPVPQISYNKKLRKDAGAPLGAESPKISQGTRKVLSHRKKLQEFYKLHAEKSESNEKQTESQPDPSESLSTAEKLKDPEELDQFIKKSSAPEMLRIRNELALKLNFRDLEKKTIIYDNYSELIKLDQTLGSVKKGSLRTAEEDRFMLAMSGEKRADFNQVFKEAQNFLQQEASVFNQDFRSVVQSVLAEARSKLE